MNYSFTVANDASLPMQHAAHSIVKKATKSPFPMHYENAKEAVQAGLYQLLIQHYSS